MKGTFQWMLKWLIIPNPIYIVLSYNGWVAEIAWILWTKGLFMFPEGQSKMVGDFVMLLRTACSFQIINCLFLEFSIWYFGSQLTVCNWKSQKLKPQIGKDYCIINLSLRDKPINLLEEKTGKKYLGTWVKQRILRYNQKIQFSKEKKHDELHLKC